MLTSKSISLFILTIRFKRHFSISAIPSTTSLRILGNGEEHKDPSQKTQKSLTSKRLQHLLETFETTHPTESHLSSSFCSRALKLSAKLGFVLEGKQLHSHILKLGYVQRLSMQNQLLNLYVRSKGFTYACQLFDEIPNRNVVSWNIMICGFLGFSHDNMHWFENPSLLYFRQMLVDMVEPDYITFIGLLGASIELNDIGLGKQLHCFMIKLKFDSNHFVGSALVDLYGKFGLVEDSWKVFDRIQSRDLVLWNAMVSCYALNGLGKRASEVFELMRLEGFKGDAFTFSSLLSCYAILGFCELGKQIHGIIMKLSFDLDVLVVTALVDMYAKNGNLQEAREIFDGMITRNVVSWNTMVVGYGQNGDGKEPMKLLRQMLQRSFKPDELTLASILSSSANLAAINEVVQVHGLGTKKGLEDFLSIGNALINAYYKCGDISCAIQSFDFIKNPNLFTWTSMICAYAFHGFSKQALEIFEQMLSEGVKPDGVAFVGVLSACSHGGLVNEGLQYFDSMKRDHKILPDSEHYSCVIDLLGRAGYLEKAYEILVNMPFEPGGDVLGAFLGACKVHKNVELAELVAEKLLKLEPDETVNYALLSNVYASVGSWIEVARVRKIMRDYCDEKVPGCSWMEIGGQVHTFVSTDKSHPQTLEIYVILEALAEVMKQENCLTNSTINSET